MTKEIVIDRIEKRFFIDTKQYSDLNYFLSNNYKKLEYSKAKITETIHFFSKETRDFDDELYIRLRRYSNSKERVLRLKQCNKWNLEIKRKDYKGGKNNKKIIKDVSIDEINSLIPEKNRNLIYPAILLQTKRNHFIFKESRLTLDDDVCLFIIDDKCSIIKKIASLNECKLEVKYKEDDTYNLIINELLSKFSFKQKDNIYMEKWVRMNYQQKNCK